MISTVFFLMGNDGGNDNIYPFDILIVKLTYSNKDM